MRAHLLAAAGAVLLAGASALGFSMTEQLGRRPYDVLHVPSSGAARLVALGHRTFLSDVYWLATVQYIGEPAAEQRGWDKLLPLVELVTDLDPRHGYAYQTAGIVLSSAGRLDESDSILKKGMAKGPAYWSFPYYLAFNSWFYRGDFASAAKFAEIAARTPGASANISHLAVSLASKSGTPEDAIVLLQELRATVRDDATAARLDEQLKLATLERDAQALERAAARFRAERGRPMTSLLELRHEPIRHRDPDRSLRRRVRLGRRGGEGAIVGKPLSLSYPARRARPSLPLPPARGPAQWSPEMTKILALTGVTIREALRQKLAVNLLVFALALVAASLTISALTFGEQYRIIVDIGLSAMEIVGTLIAVFLGAGLIARDVERRTISPSSPSRCRERPTSSAATSASSPPPPSTSS